VNKIILTQDTDIDPNGYRVFINKTIFASCAVSDISDAVRAERLTDAEKKLEEACEEINSLTRANRDLNTIVKFWRQAAEHAIAGWECARGRARRAEGQNPRTRA
jgi:cob(I)alamin adenosyltransferase